MLVITVHVFVFIVFASLDSSRVGCCWRPHDIHVPISIFLCQLRIHFIRDGRDIGQQQAEIQSIQILLQDPEARSSESNRSRAPESQESSLEVVAILPWTSYSEA